MNSHFMILHRLYGLYIAVVLLSCATPAHAQQAVEKCRIKYLSADHVYVDAGRNEGLAVGDTLNVFRNDSLLAAMEIIYTADHSSSCRIISEQEKIMVGDVALLQTSHKEQQALSPPVEQESQAETAGLEDDNIPEDLRRPSTRLSGTVSLSLQLWDDQKSSDLDFTQPALRVNVGAANLWGSDYSLRIRTHTRYNQRSMAYNSSVPRTEWRNRVYEISLGNDGEDRSFGFRFGRIIPRGLSGIGYIDGVMVHKHLSGSIKTGAFAGTQPQWQYAGVQTSLQKYGLFIGYESGMRDAFRFESTAAIAAEYHLSTVSREFVHIRNSMSAGGRWNVYQSADLDINRGWKKSRTGEGMNLSNLYLSGRYRVSGRLTLGLSYDQRRNYLTYEQRSVADSLFDDLIRQGVKFTAGLRLPGNFNVNSNFGYRKRQSESEATRSYSLTASNANLSPVSLYLSFQISGFTNHFSDGYNIAYNIGKHFRHGNYIIAGFSLYTYDYGTPGRHRSSRTYQLKGSFHLVDKIYMNGEYQKNSGDDIDGQRVLAELGYRL